MRLGGGLEGEPAPPAVPSPPPPPAALKRLSLLAQWKREVTTTARAAGSGEVKPRANANTKGASPWLLDTGKCFLCTCMMSGKRVASYG